MSAVSPNTVVHHPVRVQRQYTDRKRGNNKGTIRVGGRGWRTVVVCVGDDVTALRHLQVEEELNAQMEMNIPRLLTHS